jgi:hypothetical protein
VSVHRLVCRRETVWARELPPRARARDNGDNSSGGPRADRPRGQRVVTNVPCAHGHKYKFDPFLLSADPTLFLCRARKGHWRQVVISAPKPRARGGQSIRTTKQFYITTYTGPCCRRANAGPTSARTKTREQNSTNPQQQQFVFLFGEGDWQK